MSKRIFLSEPLKYKQNYNAFFLNTKFMSKEEGIDQRNKAILSIVLRVKTIKNTIIYKN